MLVSAFAVGIKRLNDRDRSGWWIVLFYVGPAVLDAIGLQQPVGCHRSRAVAGRLRGRHLGHHHRARVPARHGRRLTPMVPIRLRPRWRRRLGDTDQNHPGDAARGAGRRRTLFSTHVTGRWSACMSLGKLLFTFTGRINRAQVLARRADLCGRVDRHVCGHARDANLGGGGGTRTIVGLVTSRVGHFSSPSSACMTVPGRGGSCLFFYVAPWVCSRSARALADGGRRRAIRRSRPRFPVLCGRPCDFAVGLVVELEPVCAGRLVPTE